MIRSEIEWNSLTFYSDWFSCDLLQTKLADEFFAGCIFYDSVQGRNGHVSPYHANNRLQVGGAWRRVESRIREQRAVRFRRGDIARVKNMNTKRTSRDNYRSISVDYITGAGARFSLDLNAFSISFVNYQCCFIDSR